MTIILAAIVIYWLTSNHESQAPPDKGPYIDPPIAGLDIPYQNFTIEVSRGGMFESQSGSRLMVPANAFVDDSGRVVEGLVDLQYREFTNAMEILLGGVPMTLGDTSDQYLQSAGMMELHASSNGVEVYPNPERQITMKMISAQKDADFNLYFLDEEQRQWDELDNGLEVERQQIEEVPEATPNYEKLAAQQGVIKPIKPREKDPRRYQFQYKLDLMDFPEMNIYDGIEWEYAGKKSSEDPGKNAWVLDTYWYEMEMKKTTRKGIYRLHLKAGSQEFTTTVRPVFDAADMAYAAAQYEKKYQTYKAFVDKKKKEARERKIQADQLRRQRESSAKVFRAFEVSQFGYWNVDKYYNRQDLLALDLQFKNANRGPVEPTKVFLIVKDVNTVISYSGQQMNSFRCDPNRVNTLVLLDTAGKVYAVPPSEFEMINSERTAYTFTTTGTGTTADSMDDVMALLPPSS